MIKKLGIRGLGTVVIGIGGTAAMVGVYIIMGLNPLTGCFMKCFDK